MLDIHLMSPAGSVGRFVLTSDEANNLLRQGFRALHDDGTAYQQMDLYGWMLLDGCPTNVLAGEGWQVSQLQLLRPLWDNGTIPACSQAPQVLPTPVPVYAHPRTPTPPPPKTGTAVLVTPIPITAVPGPDPATTGILTAVVAVLGALWRLFGGGVSSAVKHALEGMREAITEVGRHLLNFALRLARALGRVYATLRKLWDLVLKPVFAQVAKLVDQMQRLIDRILKPYLEVMRRIRAIIFDIYGRYLGPLVESIQKVRQAMAILRHARVPFAKKLDEQLVRIQVKLLAPISALLQRTNEHSGFINILLSARMILQRPIFTRSMYVYRRSWIAQWWNEQTPGAGDLGLLRPPSVPTAVALRQAINAVDLYASAGAGPFAAPIARAIDTFDEAARSQGVLP